MPPQSQKEIVEWYERTHLTVGFSADLRLYRDLANRGNGRILDIACGEGRIFGFLSGVGCDISLTALRKARLAHRESQFVRCDASALPFRDHVFDTVYCIGAFEHFRQQNLAAGELDRVLAPLGTAYYTITNSLRFTGLGTIFAGSSPQPILRPLSLDSVVRTFAQAGLATLEVNKVFQFDIYGPFRSFGTLLLRLIQAVLPTRLSIEPLYVLKHQGEAGKIGILEICFKYPPDIGGIQVHVRDLAASLSQSGHDVRVITTGSPGDRNENGIRVTRFSPDFRVFQADLSIKLILAIIKEAKRHEALHLHLNFHFAELVTALAAWLYRRPLVISYHNDPVPPTSWAKAFNLFHTVFLLLPTLAKARNIVISTRSYAHTSWRLRLFESKSVVIPYGIDVDFFKHEVASVVPGRIVFLGRLDSSSYERKGMINLLEAVSKLAPAVEWHLCVAGPLLDETRSRLQRDAATFGVLNRVTILGELDRQELPMLLASANVFVLPSRHRGEAFGIPTLEALSCGALPVVPDLPGPSSLAPGFCITFTPGDSLDLTRALTAALKSQVSKETRQQRHELVARNFPCKETMARLQAVLTAGAVRALVASNRSAEGMRGRNHEARRIESK